MSGPMAAAMQDFLPCLRDTSIDHKFKLADSLIYHQTSVRIQKIYTEKFLAWFADHLSSPERRRKGKYHFRYFEKHYYSPKKKYHYDGQVFILIGGNSFSATTLFAGDLKGQKNVTLVGEETGGGYYGNTAWIIPDVTLPNTGLRFRLPRFRMVINKDRIKNGRGIMPDVWALPTSDAIREGVDFKAMKVRELIAQQDSTVQSQQQKTNRNMKKILMFCLILFSLTAAGSGFASTGKTQIPAG